MNRQLILLTALLSPTVLVSGGNVWAGQASDPTAERPEAEFPGILRKNKEWLSPQKTSKDANTSVDGALHLKRHDDGRIWWKMNINTKKLRGDGRGKGEVVLVFLNKHGEKITGIEHTVTVGGSLLRDEHRQQTFTGTLSAKQSRAVHGIAWHVYANDRNVAGDILGKLAKDENFRALASAYVGAHAGPLGVIVVNTLLDEAAK